MTQLFTGFSSNAVISIIAVMIIGAGLDRTGIMNKVAAWILQIGGTSEARLIPIISGTVGFISSFMQNVGAAALFLPVVSRISARSGLPLSRLLMPMGFCAILGGTMTMVGSSPMILLNDLIATSNADLPEGEKMAPFGLFAPTPIGAALILSGILYFVLLGRWILPARAHDDAATTGQSMADYLKRTYGLKSDLVEVIVPEGNILVGHTIDDIMNAHHLYIIGTSYAGQKVVNPRVATSILAPCRLAMIGRRKVIAEICDIYGLSVAPDARRVQRGFRRDPRRRGRDRGAAGLVGDRQDPDRTALPPVLRHEPAGDPPRRRNHEPCRDPSAHPAVVLGNVALQAGDTLVVHTPWEMLSLLKRNRDFVVITSDFPEEELRPRKMGWALLFFLVALSLILFTDVRLSLALLVGAVGMVLTRVLSIDEAYRAVGWNTVFLLGLADPARAWRCRTPAPPTGSRTRCCRCFTAGRSGRCRPGSRCWRPGSPW